MTDFIEERLSLAEAVLYGARKMEIWIGVFEMLGGKLWRKLDYTLILTAFLLSIMGILFIASSIRGLSQSHSESKDVIMQIIWVVCGCCVVILCACVNVKLWKKIVIPVYLITILLLVLSLIIGSKINGSQAWIKIGPVRLQPVEMGKVTWIITLAYLMERIGTIRRLRDLLPVALWLSPLLVLILKQPDLGSAMVYLVVTIGVLFVAGLHGKYFLGLTLLAIPLIGYCWDHVLDKYQRDRFLTMINPYQYDPAGAGYQLVNSLISVGSGGLTGKGIFHGPYTGVGFVPERWTDYIFAVIGEEGGFVGAGLILLLFLILIYRTTLIGIKAGSLFGLFLAIGIASMWGFHVLENVGMAIGIMPATGIPLPFISYGGSSFWANSACVGILLSISLKRETLHFQ